MLFKLEKQGVLKMKKIMILLLFIYACEDENSTNEVLPINKFIGTWKQSDIKIDYFLEINENQKIFLGDYDSDLKANIYTENNFLKSYDMKYILDGSSDTLQENIVGIYNKRIVGDMIPTGEVALYLIREFFNSEQSVYNSSAFSIDNYDTGEIEYYIGNTYLDYSFNRGLGKLTVNNDTLYNKFSTDGQIVDSTSYVLVNGSAQKLHTPVTANERISMNSFFSSLGADLEPDYFELTFEEDGRGVELIIYDLNYPSEKTSNLFTWSSTDSLLTITDLDGFTRSYFYEFINENLSLKGDISICEDFSALTECENEINSIFGFDIKSGSLVDLWKNENIILSNENNSN